MIHSLYTILYKLYSIYKNEMGPYSLRFTLNALERFEMLYIWIFDKSLYHTVCMFLINVRHEKLPKYVKTSFIICKCSSKLWTYSLGSEIKVIFWLSEFSFEINRWRLRKYRHHWNHQISMKSKNLTCGKEPLPFFMIWKHF